MIFMTKKGIAWRFWLCIVQVVINFFIFFMTENKDLQIWAIQFAVISATGALAIWLLERQLFPK